ncbi:YtxH domain-containing protein [Bacillus suaedaesalsae]|uniref:YtxH domain-containing protein n=1 Tax=Bacillus suaedaesalsae TaxID=2810349 RepID=A0ABS2DFS8_9BACI|nr:YtxH domain-containing protein [Bacillus suaedaesalsae]MBM6616408.1 YtxH domain-containing protein [Bacillus suaedaesalsae]
MSKKSSGSDFVAGAVIGALVGAATALFLAPKAGKELRADFNETASSVKSIKSLTEKGSELAEVAKEKTISLSQVVAEQSSVILDMIKEVTNQTKDHNVVDKDKPVELLEEVSTTATKSQEDFIPLKPATEDKDEF